MRSNESIIPIMQMDDQRLRIEINNDKPIDLMDLTNSFFSVADEYKRFVESEYGEVKKEDVALYVQEIRSGSIIADLVSVAPFIFPVLSQMNSAATIIAFSAYLKKGYDFLLGKDNQRPTNFKKVDYQNFANFVEPVAKDKASQLTIFNVINGNPILVYKLPSLDANAAQNAAKREMGMIIEPSTGLHRNVVLYWHQVKKDVISHTGDRAIIESIASYPVKVIFESEKVKAEMVLGDANPLTSGYLVDVSVETINGKPVLYKVLNLHERIENPVQYSMLK